MIASLKQHVALVMLLPIIPVLTGCFVMMPIMMGPQIVKSIKARSEDSTLHDTVDKLIDEGVSKVYDFSEEYSLLMMQEVKVIGKFYPQDSLKQRLLKKLKKGNAWQVLDQEQGIDALSSNRNTLQSAKSKNMASVNAQLYESGGYLHLAIQLTDALSREIIMTDISSLRPVKS